MRIFVGEWKGGIATYRWRKTMRMKIRRMTMMAAAIATPVPMLLSSWASFTATEIIKQLKLRNFWIIFRIYIRIAVRHRSIDRPPYTFWGTVRFCWTVECSGTRRIHRMSSHHLQRWFDRFRFHSVVCSRLLEILKVFSFPTIKFNFSLTFAHWILSSPVAIWHAHSGAVANQISTLCAWELRSLANKSTTGVYNQMLVDIRHWTRDFNADWRFMPPSSIFRAKSSWNTVEFEFRGAFVQCCGAVVRRVGWQCDVSVGDWRWILAVDI